MVGVGGTAGEELSVEESERKSSKKWEIPLLSADERRNSALQPMGHSSHTTSYQPPVLFPGLTGEVSHSRSILQNRPSE